MMTPPAFPQYYQTHRIDRLHLIETVTPRLEKEPNLAFAYLYGSAAEQQTVHDIDIGLYYESTETLPTSDRIFSLAHQLSSALHIPVDVRILNHAPLSFYSIRCMGNFSRANNLTCTLQFWNRPLVNTLISRRFSDKVQRMPLSHDAQC